MMRAMDHRDHVGLLRDGVPGPGRWLELGAGHGEFTLALADLLGPGGSIVAQDRDQAALQRLGGRVRAANSLHFIGDPAPVLEAVRHRLRPAGRLLLVEYDADHGNRWVPFPISFAAWSRLAPAVGLKVPRQIGRVPSRFLGAIYAAVTEVP